MRKRKTKAHGVIGHDDYLICKALAYAITTLESLSVSAPEAVNCFKMRLMLEAKAGDRMQDFLASASGILAEAALTRNLKSK